VLVLLGSVQCVAQCPNRGTVTFDEVSNFQGKPYEAKEIRTVVTYGSDGAKRVVVTKANLFRDEKGRIRIERYYDGTPEPSDESPADITIDDNCGTTVTLYPGPKTAKILHIALPQLSQGPCCEEVDLKDPPYTGPEGKFEDLGHKFVDGIEVRGERISYYTSSQAKLSGAAPIDVYENWCSKLLDTRMGSYIRDDRHSPKREITTVISDVRQVEPAPDLFEIPKDYKIISAEKAGSNTTPKQPER